jgi:antitoxin MazE
MLISVVPIGNSKGIRIPKSILKQLNIEEKVELKVLDKEIVIKPVIKKPREGWYEKFVKMHQEEDDRMIINDLDEQEDFQWEW